MDLPELTARQNEVLQLAVSGLSNKEISDKLFVLTKTINIHMTNIYRNLKIKSRAQLILQYGKRTK